MNYPKVIIKKFCLKRSNYPGAIQDNDVIPPNQKSFMLEKIQLEDGKTLTDYNIQN